MAFQIKTTLEIVGDKAMLARVSDRLRSRRRFSEQVGLLGMSQSLRRLSGNLAASEGGVRTGFLAGSFKPTGNKHTILEANEDGSGAYGSNLEYAAQRQFGGTILPKRGRALAIPLDDRLRRNGIWPRDFPDDALDYVPLDDEGGHGFEGGGGVFALLVDSTGIVKELAGGRKATRGKAMYALVRSVTQAGWFFAGWYPEDVEILEKDVFPKFLGLR